MTDYLETKIGTIVSCLYVEDGRIKGLKGRLTYVDDQYIKLDDVPLSYVNDNFAIYAIYEGEKTVIYKNETALAMSNFMVSSYSAPDQSLEPEEAAKSEEPMHPSEAEFDEMFETLEENVGNKVSIEYMYKGELNKLKGKLDSIVPYDCLTVDYQMIPFIGPYDGIITITGPDGSLIYQNEMVRGYQGCKIEDRFAIFEAQEMYLGKSVAREDYAKKEADIHQRG